MLRGISNWAMKRSATARRMLSKFWYQYVSKKFQDEPVIFMNLGYAYVKPGGKPLEFHKEEQINNNVMRALDLESEKKLDLIRRFAPWVSRGFSKQFAGVKGSRIYRALGSGEEMYINYVLHKGISPT